ncbi:MAG: protein phosphatase 2C domain-containing protein, partial [Planctomycetota bacterium]
MSDGNQNSSIEKSGFYPVARPNTFGLTDVGRRREVNQDQFLIAQLNKSMLVTSTSLPLDEKARLFGRTYGQVLFVADGMGGHAAGEEASSLAINHLVTQLLNRVHWFFQDDRDDDELFVDGLRGLLRSAHRRILNASDHNSALRGMGTTMTMAYVVWPKLWVVHAGDSRCYLVRNGKADQLTTDHTLARRLVEQGGMPPEEEAKSRWSNVLWNVLGGSGEGGELLAEVQRGDLLPGDTIVLCSDGLYRYV